MYITVWHIYQDTYSMKAQKRTLGYRKICKIVDVFYDYGKRKHDHFGENHKKNFLSL